MDINNIYELIKNIISDVKSLSDKQLATNLMGNLLELQEKLVDIKGEQAKYLDEIDNLKKKIKTLEKSNEIEWTLYCYGIAIDEKGNQHRYCQHCFAKEGKLFEIPRGVGGNRCPECKTYFGN